MSEIILDLDKLDDISITELADYKQKIEKALKEKQDKQKQKALDEIKKLMNESGITHDELAQALKFKLAPTTETPATETIEKSSHKDKRKTVPAKYKDPSSDKTWSGRGMKPRWLQAYLDEGRKIEEFKI